MPAVPTFAAIRVLLALLCLGGTAVAAEPVAPCDPKPPEGRASREGFRFTPLMAVANQLEKQGEHHFHLQYAPPATECDAGAFTAGEATITMHRATGPHDGASLAWRLVVARADGPTEILAIYDPIGTLLNDEKPFFHVSEERAGVISWYALYDEEPSASTVRTLATHIVEGSAKPLFSVTWEPGKIEGTIVAFDSKRLKSK